MENTEIIKRLRTTGDVDTNKKRYSLRDATNTEKATIWSIDLDCLGTTSALSDASDSNPDGWAKDEELTKMLEKPEISKIRESTGMSQSQFAEHYGISVRTLQDWEQGRRVMPSYVLDMIELLVEENKAGKHLAWYVISEKNGDIFGMDKPYLSLSTAMMDAYKDWNVYTTDAEKKHQSIRVALCEVDDPDNENWSGDEYKSFDIDEINAYGLTERRQQHIQRNMRQ